MKIQTNICYICIEKFEDKYHNSRDHCHYSGEYRSTQIAYAI